MGSDPVTMMQRHISPIIIVFLMEPRIRVLYVDDEPGLLQIARLFLEQSPEFKVATSPSGPEALEALASGSFDVVVSDYQMPGMDGIELLKVVRKRFGDIPFVLFTGRGREEIVIQAIESGADFYLQKGGDPVSQFAELAHKIRQALRRKEAERSKQDSEQRLSDIIDFLPDATFAIDRAGTVIAWNRAVEEMTGVPSSAMLGKGDRDYAVPFYGTKRPILIDLVNEPDDAISPFYSHISRDSSVLTAEAEISGRNGEKISVLVKACPLYNQQGERVGAIESIRDITAQKRSEEAIARSREYLDEIYTSVRAGIAIIDAATHEILDVNPAAATMIGLPKEQIVGSVCHEFICPASAGRCPITDLGQVVDNAERVLRTGNGRTLPIIKYVTRTVLDGRDILLETFLDNSARRKAEEAAKESEEKFRDLADLLPQMIFETDLEFRIVYANKHALTEFGLSDLDFGKGVGIFPFIDPSQHEQVKEAVQRMMSGGTQDPVEFVALRKDGSSFPVIVQYGPLYRQGTLVGYRGVLIDISAQKKTEDLLRESELRFKSLIQNSSDVIGVIDQRRLITYISPSVTRLFGYDPVEAVGTSPLDYVHPDDRARVEQEIESVYDRTNSGRPVEYRFRHADGQYIDVEAVAANLFDTPGIEGVVTTTRPITERKRAADELRESEEKFRTIFENSPYPIAINTAPDFRFLSVNRAFLRVSGYSEDEVLGKTPIELGLLPLPEALKLIARRLRAGTLEDVPLVLSVKGGRRVHVLFSTMPTTINSGSAVVTVTAEVTKLKRVEEDLLQTNRELHAIIEELKVTEEELQQNYNELLAKEEMVRASEAKFRALVELSLEGILIADFSGILLFANRTAGLIVDAPNYEGLIGTKNVMEFVAPESRPDVLQDFQKVAGGEDAYLVHYKLITASGRECWVECIGKRIVFEGAPAMLVSMRDVTERRQVEEQVRESEQKFATVFRSSPVPLTLVSAIDGTFVDVNEAFLRDTGYARDDVIGRVSTAIGIIPDEGEYGRFVSSLRGQSPLLGWEMTTRRQSGELRTCRFSSSVVLMGGRPHILSSVEDITEAKKTEEALRQSEQRFRALYENASDAIAVHGFTPEGRPSHFLNVNDNVCSLTGYTRDELLSMSLIDLDDPDDWQKGRRIAQQLMERGDLVFEISHVRKDGTKIPVEISAHVFALDNQRVVLSIIRDITERKRAEDALRQVNRKLTMLSGITRHDIKNQLMTLDGFVELLHQKMPDPGHDLYFSHITTASSKIAKMIQFTKEYEQIGVHAPAWQALRELGEGAGRDAALGHVTLVNDLPFGLEVYADPLIAKVFFNLVDNAVRHGGAITTVRFAVEELDGEAIIVCEDDGDGVPPAEKERIFEHGYGKNTGFGLTISREILDITGIGIREVGESGRGARFEMTVPPGVYRRTG